MTTRQLLWGVVGSRLAYYITRLGFDYILCHTVQTYNTPKLVFQCVSLIDDLNDVSPFCHYEDRRI